MALRSSTWHFDNRKCSSSRKSTKYGDVVSLKLFRFRFRCVFFSFFFSFRFGCHFGFIGNGIEHLHDEYSIEFIVFVLTFFCSLLFSFCFFFGWKKESVIAATVQLLLILFKYHIQIGRYTDEWRQLKIAHWNLHPIIKPMEGLCLNLVHWSTAFCVYACHPNEEEATTALHIIMSQP